MKRLLRHALLILLPSALLVLGGILVWLTATTGGARWLAQVLADRTRGRITVRQVEGRLLDHMRLAGVRLTFPRMEAEIDSLEIRWHLLPLVAGKVRIEELTLTGVRLRDLSPPRTTAPLLAWPEVSGIPALLEGKIARLRINGLTYRHMNGEPATLAGLSATLIWHELVLSAEGLDVASSRGLLTGTIAAGFLRPLLRLDLAATLPRPVRGMDRLSLQARLSPARAREQMAGPVTVTGSSKRGELARLTGEVGMTRTAFNLRALRLRQTGRRGEVTGSGTLIPTAGEPRLTLQLRAAGLDLAPEMKTATDLSGTVTFSGSLSQYGGRFTLANRGKGWRGVRLSGSYRGDAAGMTMALREGLLLGGRINGTVEAAWHEALSVNAELHAKGLNPAEVAADWTGEVNVDLAGRVNITSHAPPRGEVTATLLESTLHGRALTGQLAADFGDGTLRIARLDLHGRGFDIQAAGELDRRLTFTAQASDLSRLIPGTAGEARGAGWLRWHEGRLTGTVEGGGKNLAADGVRIGTAEFTARLGDEEGHPIHGAASLRNVAYDRLRIDSGTLAADGTVGRHDVTAELRSGGARVRMTLSGGYRDSSWQGEIRTLSGSDGAGPWRLVAPAPLTLFPGHVSLSSLALAGTGDERLSISCEVDRDPEASHLGAEWEKVNLARASHWLTGVAVTGTSSGRLRAEVAPGGGHALAGHATLEGEVTVDNRRLPVERGIVDVTADAGGSRGTVELRAPRGGSLRASFTSPSTLDRHLPDEGRLFGEWSGVDLALLAPWLPAAVGVTGRAGGRVEGSLKQGTRLDLAGGISLSEGRVTWQRDGDTVDASLQGATLSFSWLGMELDSRSPARTGKLAATARVDGRGTYGTGDKTIAAERFTVRLEGDDRGERLATTIDLAGGGTLHGSLSSPLPPGLAIPDQGEVAFGWTDIDAGRFRRWLPDGLGLEGRLSGRGEGKLLPGRRVQLVGEVALAGGSIRGKRPEGEVNTDLRNARATWRWQGEELSGTVDLSLAGYGQARGSFRVPLPARLPVALDRRGTMEADLVGRMEEKGLLSALFPAAVEESHGQLDLDLHVTGTPDVPRMTGSVALSGGGAYLPSAGIHLEGVQFTASLQKGLVSIDSFRAASGPGHIEGTAVIQLAGWRVTGYRGSISGERFRTVYLPELQLLTTPRLTFEGTSEKLSVRGDVTIPELLILEPSERGVIAPSKDVIIEGTIPAAKKRFPLPLDVRVRVILGNDVKVKAAGIDARLEGSVDLAFASLDKIASKGEIRVVKGRYRAYGLDLNIVRGRLYYAGGPFSRPFLDILALRTIDDLRAGVTVGGVLQAPVIKLYSEPAMTDVDTMAYMVLGHPLTSSGEQASLVAQAAGALLTTGQSFVLQDQIKNRLGLSTLEMQTVGGTTPGTMGYREVTVTPPGVSPAKAQSVVSQSLLTVGKYLTPELYVSYGRSLFTGANLFRLRYDLFKHVQVETQTGSESGVDVYYKIYFH